MQHFVASHAGDVFCSVLFCSRQLAVCHKHSGEHFFFQEKRVFFPQAADTILRTRRGGSQSVCLNE